MADAIINYTNRAREVVEAIDKNSYFELGGKGSDGIHRINLYLVAMAIGIDSSPYPLSNKNSFIRGSALDHVPLSILKAFYVQKKLDAGESIAGVTDLAEVFSMSEPYANGGFEVLGGYVNDVDDDKLLKEWIADLNERHHELFPDYGADGDGGGVDNVVDEY